VPSGFHRKIRNRVAAFGHFLCQGFLDQIEFSGSREFAQLFPLDWRVALNQLFGSKIDQIVQHARTQSDLTYRDQMVVIEGQFEGFPTLRLPVLFVPKGGQSQTVRVPGLAAKKY